MKICKKILFYLIFAVIIVCSMEFILRITGDLYLNNLYVQKNAYLRVPSKTTIICLGESSTAGLYVNRQDSYPAQLKEMLKQEYPEKDISVIVPPHVGQNTSQVSNRIKHYIDLYKPSLIVLMVGYNNEWSLAESNIGKFLKLNGMQVFKVKILVQLNKLRLFKLFRYVYLKHVKKEKSGHVSGLEGTKYMWGGPELTRWPPKKWVYPFARHNREAFVKLWRYDVQKIISTAKKNNVKIVLMTYHINPTYLPSKEFILMAREEGIPLVRNDLVFRYLYQRGVLKSYLLEDNWHTNKKGYRIIADNVFKTIDETNLLHK